VSAPARPAYQIRVTDRDAGEAGDATGMRVRDGVIGRVPIGAAADWVPIEGNRLKAGVGDGIGAGRGGGEIDVVAILVQVDPGRGGIKL
jgi:hypothetical protein